MSSMTRRLTAAMSGATLTAGLMAGVGAPQAAAATDAAREYGRHAFVASNQARDNHDRGRVRQGDCLEKYAERQARRMAAREKIWHQNLRRILRDCNMNRVGENVAAGFRNGRSVVRRGWMKSSGHRANILDGRFRRMEVAARKGDDGRWYVAQVFGRHG